MYPGGLRGCVKGYKRGRGEKGLKRGIKIYQVFFIILYLYSYIGCSMVYILVCFLV